MNYYIYATPENVESRKKLNVFNVLKVIMLLSLTIASAFDVAIFIIAWACEFEFSTAQILSMPLVLTTFWVSTEKLKEILL